MALLLFFFYLSQLALAHGSAVKFLPGFEGPLPFELETGYVGVGDSEEAQFFYYLVKSEGKPKDDPLLLWLTGGPGCSAFSALALEIGPLKFKVDVYNGSLPTLVYNPYAWTKVSNIIFIDSPVGTGFSYARNNPAAQTSDLKQVHHLHQFLRKWLMAHPDFISIPVYVSGDSYSGIPVPVLAQEISNGKTLTLTSCRDEVSTFIFPLHHARNEGIKPIIHLQGYMLRNPITRRNLEENFMISYVHRMGIISDELYETYELYLCLYWAIDADVRNTLQIRKGSIAKWLRCNLEFPYDSDVPTSFPYHAILSAKGYRALIYSGDHDTVVPYLATQAWIRFLNYPIIDDWRPWKVQGQIAGEEGIRLLTRSLQNILQCLEGTDLEAKAKLRDKSANLETQWADMRHRKKIVPKVRV